MGLSRRDFVQAAISLGVSTSVAEAILAEQARTEPKRGGLFRAGIGHGETSDSLDPATWANSFTINFGTGLIGDGLTEISAKNEAVGNLAESIESSDHAKTWVFKLRKGVTFHNGKSLTSTDVVATYNYHRKKESKSAVRSLLSPIIDIKTDGPETVIFTLNEGLADFPYIAADYHLAIFAAKNEASINWERGIGTGAFILESFNPGVRAKARRNANYHGTVWFDEAELLAIFDVTARTNALSSGDIHFMDRCDLKTLDLLRLDPKVEITDITGFSHYYAPMNVTISPFDDVNVRLALKHSINRAELVQKVLLDHGAVGNDNPIAPSVKYAIEPTPQHTYDPERAKYYLRKAGVSKLSLNLSASDAAFTGAIDAALLISESAKACDIDVKVVREAADGYWTDVWNKKPWCLSYFGGRPTVDWMMTLTYAAGALWNDTGWNNQRFNELLHLARGETDEHKRGEMYAEMQQLVHDDGGSVVLMFNNFVSAQMKNVGHGPLNSNLDHDGGYMARHWWFT